jgi:lysophospholipase L1-like esterase
MFKKKNSIYVAALLIVLLCIIESILRMEHIIVKSTPYTLSLDNFHPFLQGRLTTRNNMENNLLHINSFGFRGPEITKNKTQSTYRIIVLGGSTVLNVGIPFEQTFGNILQEKLQKIYPDKKIEVLNGGMDGYTSEHSLIQYLFFVKDFHPDLLIMWHGINDMYESCVGNSLTYKSYQSDYSHNFGSLANIIHSYYTQEQYPLFFHIHFVTFDFIAHAFFYNFYSDINPYFHTNVLSFLIPHFLHPILMKEFPSLISYKRNLSSFIQITKTDGVPLILGNQPFLYSLSIDKQFVTRHWYMQSACATKNTYPTTQSLIDGITRFNNATKDIASQYSVPFVDLERILPKTFTYFFDDVHNSAKGNASIANALFTFITTHEYIK